MGRGTRAARRGRAGPPDGWTHRELLGHLERRGLRYAVHQTPLHYGADGAGVYLARRDHPGSGDEDVVRRLYSAGDPAVAYVQLWPSAQGARDQAGVLGPRALVWGRFLFVAAPAHLALIRDALR